MFDDHGVLIPSIASLGAGTWPTDLYRDHLKSTLLNLISVPFTDIALLLIMLIGLFRLRGHGSNMFGMTKVLWSQVCYRSLLGPSNSLICFPVGRVSFGSWLLL